jgi:hypothetical protein
MGQLMIEESGNEYRHCRARRFFPHFIMGRDLCHEKARPTVIANVSAQKAAAAHLMDAIVNKKLVC